MVIAVSRTKHRKIENGFNDEQRITALERDADLVDDRFNTITVESNDRYERLEAKINKLYVTSVSILVSVATAAILLALNLIVRSS